MPRLPTRTSGRSRSAALGPWSVGAVGAFAVAACVAASASCSIYGAGLLEPGIDGSVAETSSTPDAAVDVLGACDRDTLPPRPTTIDAGLTDAGDGLDLTFAVRNLRIDVEPGLSKEGLGPATGLDLDGLCTCPGPAACTGKLVCDDARGRDNVLGPLTALLGGAADLSGIDYFLKSGQATILVRIEGYNGLPDDDQVTFRFVNSLGLERPDGGTVGPAKFDGKDAWSIEPKSLVGGSALLGRDCDAPTGSNPCLPLPENSDTTAYVANGTLVARLHGVAHLLFPLGVLREVDLAIRDAKVVARVALRDDGVFELQDGMLAARISVVDYLKALANGPDVFATANNPLGKLPALCTNTGAFDTLRKATCGTVDLPSDPANDAIGTAPCDAMSIGTSFIAVGARRGHVNQPTRTNDCPPDFVPTCD
ncbi:MAG: hypothetical protein U0169_17735 [Polyangiaceae bacterium]